MRYYLPPQEDDQPRSLAPLARVGAPLGALAQEPEPMAPAGGRLVRTVTLTPAEAGAYLRRWESERPGVRALAAPEGIVARERSRPDRSVPGATRRQRLAVRAGTGGAVAVHWSAPEPVAAADEAAWTRALGRLTGSAPGAPGGWAA